MILRGHVEEGFNHLLNVCWLCTDEDTFYSLYNTNGVSDHHASPRQGCQNIFYSLYCIVDNSLWPSRISQAGLPEHLWRHKDTSRTISLKKTLLNFICLVQSRKINRLNQIIQGLLVLLWEVKLEPTKNFDTDLKEQCHKNFIWTETVEV